MAPSEEPGGRGQTWMIIYETQIFFQEPNSRRRFFWADEEYTLNRTFWQQGSVWGGGANGSSSSPVFCIYPSVRLPGYAQIHATSSKPTRGSCHVIVVCSA